ncbi:hypothetical protein HYU96_02855 [Candidatus Daviesbacteria bacterium]|nr:hypothetical protein [Candidatus Daviesbacteria bacterium]
MSLWDEIQVRCRDPLSLAGKSCWGIGWQPDPDIELIRARREDARFQREIDTVLQGGIEADLAELGLERRHPTNPERSF